MNDHFDLSEKKGLVANWKALERVFLRPENEATKKKLVKYMEQILFGLHDFLKKHVGITEEASLIDLSNQFKNSTINDHPSQLLADGIRDIINQIAPHAVNVASPYFIGHMTSAIPFFMIHLHTIVAALNQNVVKLETSKIVSIHERQVLAKIHRLVYKNDSYFYDQHIQTPESTLGCFVSDGTIANLTAMWVARNSLFKAKPGFSGIENEGIASAYKAYGIEKAVVLVSQLGHYSLRKAGGVLGIGNENVIRIGLNNKHQIDIQQLEKTIQNLNNQSPKVKIIAVVGIAGATETGTIDPLETISDICIEHKIHFHVDAAWGGPTLLSDKYARLLKGIERADSVTIDGHKQFYMPMTCGMIFFKNPKQLDTIAYHSAYVNRPGSVDLGIRSLEGSRAANSLTIGNALEIMGRKGYELLIDHGIETCAALAQEIESRPLFQLITKPSLNILTYQIIPEAIVNAYNNADMKHKKELMERINQVNIMIQRAQRQAGKSFVSRTTLIIDQIERVVLRCVIMNPMTNMSIIREILDEQEAIYEKFYQS